MLSLLNFPRTVEPAANLLELKVHAGSLEEAQLAGGNWTVFHRQQPPADLAAPRNAVHFFGPNVEPAALRTLLAYDASGWLRYTFDKENGDWVQTDVPEEATGAPVYNPSLRLVFSDVWARQAFVEHVKEMLANGQLALVGDFIHIDVAQEQ